jgi:hypothetical protein
VDSKKLIAPVGLAAAGVIAGMVLAGTWSANAANTPTPGASSSATDKRAAVDESKSQRSDETLLTGTTKDKVEAAVKAKYPGATIVRTESDSDGVYESHVTLADGSRAIVQVGKDFAVTGTQTGGGRGGPGGHGDRGGPPETATTQQG